MRCAGPELAAALLVLVYCAGAARASAGDAAACDTPQMAPPPRSVPFVLLGVGGVGAELLRSIVKSRALHAERYGLRLSALAVCDSSGVVRPAEAGAEVSDEALSALIAHKERGGKLATASGPEVACEARPADVPASEFLRTVTVGTSGGAIVVDCTASDATLPALLHAAASPSMRVVMANKKPVTASLQAWDGLCGPRVRFESTVGAGLPAISSLQRVVASGDPVTRIAGSLSGTLGFVMSALQGGRPFSAVVADARARGFTEPDPRDDLGGVDVARKALILARVLGLRLEMGDVSIEPLYDASSMGGLSVQDFMAALPSLDAGLKARVDAAAADGKVLRYAATVDVVSGTLVVGMQAVAAGSALGSLRGTDNLIEIYSRVYPSSPLVIRGAGAGVESTAAGVLADMVELAFSRGEPA
jgi:aspartokinase/homoserine dehydrogenase 1